MLTEPESLRAWRALSDWNLGFLQLMTRPDGPDGGCFGLHKALIDQLRSLDAETLQRVAKAPCLLPDIDCSPEQKPAWQVEEPSLDKPLSAGWQDAVAIYTGGLVIWVRETLLNDPVCGCLSLSPGFGNAEAVAALNCAAIHKLANGAVARTRASFCDHPSLWPDLLSAASREKSYRQTARMVVIPLSVASVSVLPRQRRMRFRSR